MNIQKYKMFFIKTHLVPKTRKHFWNKLPVVSNEFIEIHRSLNVSILNFFCRLLAEEEYAKE